MKRLLFLFVGLLAGTAFSQEATVSTEILTLALDEPVTNLYFHNGKEISFFQANLTGLGEPLAYKGPQQFVLRASEAEFTAKPPLPAPVASVSLPLNADRVLLVCVKSADKPLKLVPYDIGKGRLTVGDYRFFNFSHSTLSMIFGTKRFAVAPGTDSVVSDPEWKKEVIEIDMEVAVVKDQKAKSVYSSVWGHRPGRRNFVFMFDGVHDYDPIRICRFFDVPSKEPEKKAP